MSDESTRNRAALDMIAATIRGMTLRPGMYGHGCCIETKARTLMALRRALLGSEADAPCQPGRRVGVLDRFLKEQFKSSQMPAYCHLRHEDERIFAVRVAEFVGEWWRREQKAAPDLGLDWSEEEALLSGARATLASMSAACCASFSRRALAAGKSVASSRD